MYGVCCIINNISEGGCVLKLKNSMNCKDLLVEKENTELLYRFPGLVSIGVTVEGNVEL